MTAYLFKLTFFGSFSAYIDWLVPWCRYRVPYSLHHGKKEKRKEL